MYLWSGSQADVTKNLLGFSPVGFSVTGGRTLSLKAEKLACCGGNNSTPVILFLFPHLDAEDVGASFDELVCQFQIVVQGVLLPHGVWNVSCVRDGGLHHTTCCSGGLHAQQHVWHVVQRVEHTEDVHAILLGHLAEPGRKLRKHEWKRCTRTLTNKQKRIHSQTGDRNRWRKTVSSWCELQSDGTVTLTHNDFVFMRGVTQIIERIRVEISSLYRLHITSQYLHKYNILTISMKSELPQPAGAHNNWEKCTPASLSKLLVVKPSHYCLVPAFLIRFFITVLSAYCVSVQCNICTHCELLFGQINRLTLCCAMRGLRDQRLPVRCLFSPETHTSAV